MPMITPTLNIAGASPKIQFLSKKLRIPPTKAAIPIKIANGRSIRISFKVRS
jgi:hypothetical protein